MEYQLYLTTNMKTGMGYIGAHCCNCEPSCTYLGSGTALKEAIKEYGLESFTRKVLEVFDTKEELLQAEAEVVNKNWMLNECNYNLATGGQGSKALVGGTCSYETKQKISASNLGGKKTPIKTQVAEPFNASNMVEPKNVGQKRSEEFLENSMLYDLHAKKRKTEERLELYTDRARLFGKG